MQDRRIFGRSFFVNKAYRSDTVIALRERFRGLTDGLPLQAAFLETGNGESTLEEDILNDNLLFEDDTATTIPAPSPVQENCSIAVRAATLLRLHYQAAVV